MTCVAVNSTGFPPSTLTVQPAVAPPPANEPLPWKNVILFFLNRYRIPSLFCATTFSLRAIIFATSIATLSISIPCSANACPACSKFSEDWRSAFEGMQPTFVHVPPGAGLPPARDQSSMHAVFSPSCAARIAAM